MYYIHIDTTRCTKFQQMSLSYISKCCTSFIRVILLYFNVLKKVQDLLNGVVAKIRSGLRKRHLLANVDLYGLEIWMPDFGRAFQYPTSPT